MPTVTIKAEHIPLIDRAADELRGGFRRVAAGKQLKGQQPLEDMTPPTWEELGQAFAHAERTEEELKQAKERVKELTEEHNGAREHLRELGRRMRYRHVDPDTGEVRE